MEATGALVGASAAVVGALVAIYQARAASREASDASRTANDAKEVAELALRRADSVVRPPGAPASDTGAMAGAATDPGPFLHGTKADLQLGALLQPGYQSNFGQGRRANFTYFTATLDAATWGAELALGDGPGRIYLVEPTGPFEDDPNLTDKKFPGNPTRSYRTQQPVRVVGELTSWQPHPLEVLQQMRDRLDELKRRGVEAIDD